MYTYYSMTAMKLPFTGGLKRSMTTIQITQLVVGCGLASSYFFLKYNPSAYPAGAILPPVVTFSTPSLPPLRPSVRLVTAPTLCSRRLRKRLSSFAKPFSAVSVPTPRQAASPLPASSSPSASTSLTSSPDLPLCQLLHQELPEEGCWQGHQDPVSAALSHFQNTLVPSSGWFPNKTLRPIIPVNASHLFSISLARSFFIMRYL